jgi:hypothetical protein
MLNEVQAKARPMLVMATVGEWKVESKNPKVNEDGICVWCGSLGLLEGSSLCSPQCKAAWSQVCTDPVVAAEREEIERRAPFYLKLDERTKRQFDESVRLAAKVGRVKFGLAPPFPDGPPLCPAKQLRPVPEVDVRASLPTDYDGDYCPGIQEHWTDNPFDRLVHGLLDLHKRSGRLYNELIKPETRISKTLVERLKFDVACSFITADAEEALTMEMVRPKQPKFEVVE